MNVHLGEMKSPGASVSKCALFGVIGVMMLIVLKMDLRVFNAQDPIWQHYRSFKWWLLPHAVTAGLALILGPLQFSARVRRLSLRRHRWLGRMYVYGVVAGAPLGVWIEYFNFRTGNGSSLRMVVATCGFAALFLLTTGVGFFMARRRNIAGHQKWMIRSYAVALVFLEVRCVEQIPWLGKLMEWPAEALESHSISDLWLYIILSLVAAECVIWRTTFQKPGKSPAAPVNAPWR